MQLRTFITPCFPFVAADLIKMRAVSLLQFAAVFFPFETSIKRRLHNKSLELRDTPEQITKHSAQSQILHRILTLLATGTFFRKDYIEIKS